MSQRRLELRGRAAAVTSLPPEVVAPLLVHRRIGEDGGEPAGRSQPFGTVDRPELGHRPPVHCDDEALPAFRLTQNITEVVAEPALGNAQHTQSVAH